MKFSRGRPKPHFYADDFCNFLQKHRLFLCRLLNFGGFFMLMSLAVIFIFGSLLGYVFERLRLPRLVGMLLAGIICGPAALNLFDAQTLGISAGLRQAALVIILVKAGLSLDIGDLKRTGRPALLMSFVPACFEIGAVMLIAPPLLGISVVEAAIMGAVLGAVSPAVVVPKMVSLMESGWGTDKKIPQMILAGASLDDVFVIVIFTSVVEIEQGNGISVLSLLDIPVSILLGIAAGALCGLILSAVFHRIHMRDSQKTILILGIAFLCTAGEDIIGEIVPFSGLLAVMAMSMTIRVRRSEAAGRLSAKFSRLWVGAEVILFVLVGAAVDIGSASDFGIMLVAVIFAALAVRCVGVMVCMIKTELNLRERIYCAIAYIPKATVQAAIGSVPLALGIGCGHIVLNTAVLSIILTAPLGAVLMELTYKRLLNCTGTDIQQK